MNFKNKLYYGILLCCIPIFIGLAIWNWGWEIVSQGDIAHNIYADLILVTCLAIIFYPWRKQWADIIYHLIDWASSLRSKKLFILKDNKDQYRNGAIITDSLGFKHIEKEEPHNAVYVIYNYLFIDLNQFDNREIIKRANLALNGWNRQHFPVAHIKAILKRRLNMKDDYLEEISNNLNKNYIHFQSSDILNTKNICDEKLEVDLGKLNMQIQKHFKDSPDKQFFTKHDVEYEMITSDNYLDLLFKN